MPYAHGKEYGVFRPGFSTAAKKSIQIDLYYSLQKNTPPSRNMLVLPGRDPRWEMECIEHFFPKAKVWAFDRDPKAVDAAINIGVYRAAVGDLEYDECFPGKTFDFANIDLCSQINDRSKGIVFQMAQRSKISCFFVSYGKDDLTEFENAYRFGKDLYPDLVRQLRGLPRRNKGRVLSLYYAACGYGRKDDGFFDYKVLRIYFYKGSGWPMMGIILTKDKNLDPWTDFVVR